jgi:hypothetical protein
MPSKPPEIHENGEKTGGFAHVLAYKSPKMPFFAQKYLTRYTHETFFDKYVNFQNHYLSHCGVKPVQSFGSHMPPATRIRVNVILPPSWNSCKTIQRKLIRIYSNYHVNFKCAANSFWRDLNSPYYIYSVYVNCLFPLAAVWNYTIMV